MLILDHCPKNIIMRLSKKVINGSDVAKDFPGGRVAHPEGQNEDKK